MNKAYSRINWQNQPSTSTALGATNLNKMDIALNSIDDRVITLDTTKLDLTTANSMVKSFSLNQSTGVITITLLDGTVTTYDTKLEKLAVNFAYDATAQQLVITLDDGTKQYVDMSALITQYEFKDSSTVGFAVDASGKVSASVKNGSITADKLQPNYLADITAQQQTATAQAKLAKRYAVGGVETGDTTDNAKYYKEQAELFKTQAKQYRDEAQDISNVGIAGESKLGLVKGDGNVEIESDGDMWADPYKDKGTATGKFINFQFADDAMAQVNIKGATTVTPANPDLPISPDNKATLVSAQNFDLVSTGKNVADIMKTTSTTSGVTIIEHSKNKLKFSAVKGASKNVQINNCVWLEKGESYKISRKFNIISGAEHASPTTGLMRLFRTVNGVYTLKDVGVGTNEVTYVSVPETGYWHLTFFITGNAETTGDIVIEFTDIQVEKGTVLSSYENYKEDRINIPYELGEWNEIKDGEYVKGAEVFSFNGTENWVKSPNTSIDRYYIGITSCKPNSKLHCTHFIYSTNTTTVLKNEISVNLQKNVFINFADYGTTTLEQFKAYLADQYAKGTPVKIRYELETPLITPLNTYLKTFKGTTNIYTTANPQVELTATFKSQLWADSYLKDNAIESKIDANKRVNNLLATDPETILAGPMGKQLQENIDSINSKISFENVAYNPTNTGKSTLREYLISLLSNTSKITGIFTCSAFTDLPRTDWGYTVEFVRSGTVFIKLYTALSSGKGYYIREIGSDNQWMGDWLRLDNGVITESDCNAPKAINTYCDTNTLNTPYKQGKTNGTNGLCISVRGDGTASTWNSQLFIVDGTNETFRRSVGGTGWTSWELLNNDLSPISYTGATESYATANGKYAYFGLPVLKNDAKNVLVSVLDDEYVVYGVYHNSFNWIALVAKVDDTVPLSTVLTVNYTVIK